MRPIKQQRDEGEGLPAKSSKRFTDDALQLVRKRELAELLRINTFTLDNWRKAGLLPQPLTLSPQIVAWRRADILAWLAEREANPARTRAPNARQHRRGGR
jgi:predicted DNA-binding transcriptional regulator AlpA